MLKKANTNLIPIGLFYFPNSNKQRSKKNKSQQHKKAVKQYFVITQKYHIYKWIGIKTKKKRPELTCKPNTPQGKSTTERCF